MITKRRREDDEDDELGKMMGGTKRRNSSVSLSSQAGRLQVDGSASPDPGSSNNHHMAVQLQYQQFLDQNAGHAPPVQQHASNVGAPGHSHTLRRKGSLKTRNETPASTAPGRLAIKPTPLAAAKSPHEHHQSAEGNGNTLSAAPENGGVTDAEESGGGNG